MESPPDLSDGRIGIIEYPSASPFEIHHILCKMDSVPHHAVFGSLLMPEHPASDPMPCVVAVHGSLNWRGHHHEHIVGWLEAGFAVFRVHSFDSRLIESTVEDQMSVTYAMMLTDVYQALRMLSTHPAIDAARIGIAGWSLGGHGRPLFLLGASGRGTGAWRRALCCPPPSLSSGASEDG